jgi:homospermidine synthase
MLESSRRLIILGYGSISRGLISLIKAVDPDRLEGIVVLAANVPKSNLDSSAPRFVREILHKDNLSQALGKLADKGDILCNLTIGVGTGSLIDYCRQVGLLYLDTSNESWYGDESFLNTFSRRQKVTARKEVYGPGAPTSLICHGANPGLVTHFLKEAILEAARSLFGDADAEEIYGSGRWGEACKKLGIKRIDISERDTQHVAKVAPFTFYNTWSVPGLFEEFFEPPCFAVHTDQMVEGKSAGKLFIQSVGKPVNAKEILGFAIDETAYTWLPSFQ